MKKPDKLKLLLGDIRVEEAPADMMVTVRPVDIKSGVQHNAVCCALSQAIHRCLSDRSIFLSKVAYLLLPDAYGEERWVRFTLPAATQNFIWKFDRYGAKGVLDLNHTLTLRAPTPGRTLLAQRNAVKAFKQRQVGKKIKPVTPRRPFTGRRATLQHIPMLAA